MPRISPVSEPNTRANSRLTLTKGPTSTHLTYGPRCVERSPPSNAHTGLAVSRHGRRAGGYERAARNAGHAHLGRRPPPRPAATAPRARAVSVHTCGESAGPRRSREQPASGGAAPVACPAAGRTRNGAQDMGLSEFWGGRGAPTSLQSDPTDIGPIPASTRRRHVPRHMMLANCGPTLVSLGQFRAKVGRTWVKLDRIQANVGRFRAQIWSNVAGPHWLEIGQNLVDICRRFWASLADIEPIVAGVMLNSVEIGQIWPKAVAFGQTLGRFQANRPIWAEFGRLGTTLGYTLDDSGQIWPNFGQIWPNLARKTANVGGRVSAPRPSLLEFSTTIEPLWSSPGFSGVHVRDRWRETVW